jgi:hypothetical protein
MRQREQRNKRAFKLKLDIERLSSVERHRLDRQIKVTQHQNVVHNERYSTTKPLSNNAKTRQMIGNSLLGLAAPDATFDDIKQISLHGFSSN